MKQNGHIQPICDIIIPIWNQKDVTRRCLESLLAFTHEPIRFILIDNASGRPTQRFLEQFQTHASVPVQLIRNDRNLGFIRASNQGILAASAPWICLLNNDTTVTPGWLGEMIRVADSDPRIGLVNPTSNSLGYPTGTLSPQAYAQRLKAQSGRWIEIPVALGFCLLARRDLFERIGLLDEGYGMGYFEDDDLSLRARVAGFLCVQACAAYVHHMEQTSFSRLQGRHRAFQRNRNRFESRWGRRVRILWVVPPEGSVSHDRISALVQAGHWIEVMGIPSLAEPFCSMVQVRWVSIDPKRWRFQAMWRLLRRRKKPFSLVVCEDTRLLDGIQRWKWLHRAIGCRPDDLPSVFSACKILFPFRWSS